MIRDYDLIRLNFTSPLHLSNIRPDDYGVSENIIHSDTLYSAILSTWAYIGKSEWIGEDVGFKISSMFPYTLEENKYCYFFPKPMNLKVSDQLKKDSDFQKKIKKVEFVEKELFEGILSNKDSVSEDDIRGKYLSNHIKDPNPFISSVTPRIMRPRDETEDTKIFYIDKLFFKENAGLFFLVKFDNAEARNRLNIALSILKDQGFGTDRSIGNGQFEFDSKNSCDRIAFNLPHKTKYVMNLGLFCPKDKNAVEKLIKSEPPLSGKCEGQDEIQYELINRGGWVGEPYNTYRKRSVYMFREGSVFFNNPEYLDGKVVDLKPENTPIPVTHPIYRFGNPLFFPINFD